MKLSGLFLGAVFADPVERASRDFGIKYASCDGHFRPGKAWPLQGSRAIEDYGDTVRLCQNRYQEPIKYASLFSVDERIPVYSAIKVRRNPNDPSYARPSSNWHHVSLGLCLAEGTSLPTTRSFLSNISSTYSSEYEFCGLHQAIDEDYKGNTGDLNIDRGHVVPNAIVNFDESAQRATFTLTNIAPQHSNFNQKAWNQLECMVRTFMDREIPNQDAYIITGTMGTKEYMNENNASKRIVRLPEYYYKAFCHVGSSTFGWVYVQKNLNTEDKSSGDHVMTISSFTSRYMGGQALFDSTCQNASLGPWFAISQDWQTYKSRYGC